MINKKNWLMTALFILSFIPILIVLCLSIYNAVNGHSYESWIEPNDTYTAYGIEEFCNSIYYYGGYLTFVIPLFEVCFFYQIFYIIMKLKRRVK